jgi:acetyl-CoA C-acetyltransferase
VASSTDRSVIVGGARTPVGKLAGALSSFTAQDLGGFAIEAALERAGISGSDVDYVIMGQVLQAGQGQITARQAAVKGGIPMDVPAVTINKVCLSGLNAIAMADQLIRAGEFDVVVAGGMESMTQAPYLLPKARQGYRYGNAEILDATYHDGLFDAFDGVPMGEATETHNDTHGFSREEQDEYAARSHELAAAAIKEGRFADEIVPVQVPQRKGDPVVVSEDEGVRPGTSAESLGKLRPAFRKDGTITAGNASQISDGAAAVVVMSRAKAEQLGVTDRILAEVGAHGVVAGPDNSLQLQPALAIRAALAKSDVALEDLKVIEVNEAFAAVGLASQKDLGLGNDVFNPNGGAIALGHPIGASGARLALTVVHELKRRGGGAGAAALCGGGGQGDAVVFHVPTA